MSIPCYIVLCREHSCTWTMPCPMSPNPITPIFFTTGGANVLNLAKLAYRIILREAVSILVAQQVMESNT